MEVTLQENGRKTQKPTVGEWFEVKPQAIDQRLFETKREDYRQEAARKLILQAFAKMKNNPEKYGKNFETMMPKKTWDFKTVAELKEMASKLGDHNADWIEQALEWAQRIANGESWKAICNDKDTVRWFRLVVWKNGSARLAGGPYCPDERVSYERPSLTGYEMQSRWVGPKSCRHIIGYPRLDEWRRNPYCPTCPFRNSTLPASNVCDASFRRSRILVDTIPLVVR